MCLQFDSNKKLILLAFVALVNAVELITLVEKDKKNIMYAPRQLARMSRHARN